MSKVNESKDKLLDEKIVELIANNGAESILHSSAQLLIASAVVVMLDNKNITSPTHEWLCFTNLLDLIKNKVMERLEKEDYFK